MEIKAVANVLISIFERHRGFPLPQCYSEKIIFICKETHRKLQNSATAKVPSPVCWLTDESKERKQTEPSKRHTGIEGFVALGKLGSM